MPALYQAAREARDPAHTRPGAQRLPSWDHVRTFEAALPGVLYSVGNGVRVLDAGDSSALRRPGRGENLLGHALP